MITGEAEGLLAKANAKASAVQLVADAIAKKVRCCVVELHLSSNYTCFHLLYNSAQQIEHMECELYGCSSFCDGDDMVGILGLNTHATMMR